MLRPIIYVFCCVLISSQKCLCLPNQLSEPYVKKMVGIPFEHTPSKWHVFIFSYGTKLTGILWCSPSATVASKTRIR